MAIGGPVLKQHIVEFIRGVGIRTDGVLTSSASTSFSWEVPQGVAQIFITGVGGGGGGGSGYNIGTARSGGGGGGSGGWVINLPVYVYPKSTLTISPGQGGSGGTVGSDNSANGTVTSITGLPTAHPWTLCTGASTGQFTLGYGQRGRGFTAASSSSSGGGGTNFNSTSTLAGGAVGSTFPNGAGTPGINTNNIVSQANFDLCDQGFGGCAGGAGGAASTDTPNPPVGAAGTAPGNISTSPMSHVYIAPGVGGADGTNSYGGGGTGGHSPWGFGGAGGGNVTGTAQTGASATGYGAGGGGGGGAGAGGAGADGYVMITYFSYD